MTREEAIEVIKEYRDNLIISPSNQLDGDVKAFDMAIQALEQNESAEKWYKLFVEKLDEQEPCDKCKYFDGNSCQHYDYKVGYTQGYEDASNRFGQEPCDDAISREAVLQAVSEGCQELRGVYGRCEELINALPPVTQKSGKCKNCKYFEYDSVAKVDGIPLIVAHEICNKWGDGCKTSENGYCYLFEPQESEDKG